MLSQNIEYSRIFSCSRSKIPCRFRAGGVWPPLPHCKRAKSRFIIEVYNKSDLLRGWSFSVGKNRPHDLIYYKGGFIIMVFIIRVNRLYTEFVIVAPVIVGTNQRRVFEAFEIILCVWNFIFWKCECKTCSFLVFRAPFGRPMAFPHYRIKSGNPGILLAKR